MAYKYLGFFNLIADYNHLKEALHVAEEFLNCINENIRVKENLDRMEWLQKNVQNDLNLVFNSNTNKLGPRKLQHFGMLSKVGYIIYCTYFGKNQMHN